MSCSKYVFFFMFCIKKKKKITTNPSRNKTQKPRSHCGHLAFSHPSYIICHDILLILMPKYSLSQDFFPLHHNIIVATLSLTSNWFACICTGIQDPSPNHNPSPDPPDQVPSQFLHLQPESPFQNATPTLYLLSLG